MAALTEGIPTEWKKGETIGVPVAADAIIYAGSLVMVNAAGYAVPGADTAGCTFIGFAIKEIDNTDGADGDLNIIVQREGIVFLAASGMAITDRGTAVYIVDDQTVGVAATTTNDVFVGVIAEFVSATNVGIDIHPGIIVPDIVTQIVVADPGDAGAIPVLRSGVVALTTTGVDDTRTLAIPTFAGQRVTISLDVDAGDAVLTVAAAVNQTGNNTITMADAGDAIELVAVQVAGALVWRLVYNDGGALTTV